ncbi:UPF0758 protein yeeS, partial [Escherichia coli HVH 88 (4-5854636)]
MQQLSFLPGEMTPGERSLIQRALKTLDRHLHEPGVAFTSTRAAREWLILKGVFDRIEEKCEAMQSLILPPAARQALAQAALTY